MNSENSKIKRDYWGPLDKDINEMKVGEIAYVPNFYIDFKIDKVLNTAIDSGWPVSEKPNGFNLYPVIRTENGIYFKRGNKKGLNVYEAKDIFFKEVEETNKKEEERMKKDNENMFSLKKHGEVYIADASQENCWIHITRKRILKKFSYGGV